MIGGQDVAQLMGDRLANSLLLGGITAAIVIPVALAAGIVAAIRRGGAIDRAISLVAVIMISLLESFTAYALILIFSFVLGWLPPIVSFRAAEGIPWIALILPVATLATVTSAYIMRMTRSAIVNLLDEPYVEAAILKGLPMRTIVLKHVVRNAAGPIANVVALNIGYLIVGVVVVEAIFNYHWIGQLFVDAVLRRDIPVVQACAMFLSLVYVGLNLCVDLLIVLIDPRTVEGRS